MIKLFPDQSDQIERLRHSLARHRNVLMQASTGAGKTVMAAYMLQGAMSKGTDSWFVVPRNELLRQTSRTLTSFNIPHSYIASGQTYNPLDPVHAVSLQTVIRRLNEIKPPKLAFIDEVHWGGAMVNTLINWLRSHGSYIIGLSATPKLTNGDGMGKWFDDIVLGESIADLIAAGRLSEFKLFAPYVPDLSEIKKTAGDYNKKSMQHFMDEHGKVMIGNAVKTYADNAMGMLGLTFNTSIIESKRTAQAYNEAGIPAAHLDGTMSADVRKRVIEMFAERQLLQLCSVDLMAFGFDLAAQIGRDVTVECMSDLAPTKSESRQLQKWGRVLRAKDRPALIFDHSGNAFEHGMPDADREWGLEGREKRRRGSTERSIPMRQCTECHFCHEPLPKCPNCGHIYPVQSRVVEEIDGELREVQEIERRKRKRMEVGKAKTYSELLAIAKERGYKPHWAKIMAQKKGIRV